MNELLTTKEVAKILAIKPQTLNKWRCLGIHLKFIKVGSRVRYQRSDVDEFLISRYRTRSSIRGIE
jgi:excisionase family DNA binding protein